MMAEAKCLLYNPDHVSMAACRGFRRFPSGVIQQRLTRTDRRENAFLYNPGTSIFGKHIMSGVPAACSPPLPVQESRP